MPLWNGWPKSSGSCKWPKSVLNCSFSCLGTVLNPLNMDSTTGFVSIAEMQPILPLSPCPQPCTLWYHFMFLIIFWSSTDQKHPHPIGCKFWSWKRRNHEKKHLRQVSHLNCGDLSISPHRASIWSWIGIHCRRAKHKIWDHMNVNRCMTQAAQTINTNIESRLGEAFEMCACLEVAAG